MKRLAAAAVLSTAAVADVSPFWENVYGRESAESVLGSGATASRAERAPKRSASAWHPSLDAIEYHSVATLASAGARGTQAEDSAPGGSARREMERVADAFWLDAHQEQGLPGPAAKPAAALLRPAHVEAAVQAAAKVRAGSAAGTVKPSWHDFAAATEHFQDEGVKNALQWERMGRTVEEMKSEAVAGSEAARDSAALEHREAVLELGKLRQAIQKVARRPKAFLQVPAKDKASHPAPEETIEDKREDDVASRVAREESDRHRFSYVGAKSHRTVPVHVHAQKAGPSALDPSPSLPMQEHQEAHEAHVHAQAHAQVEEEDRTVDAAVDAEAAADEADHTEVHYKSSKERAGHHAAKISSRSGPGKGSVPEGPQEIHKSSSSVVPIWAAWAMGCVSVLLSAAM